jgi:glycosyltransferase involved in cell wall biosynthesis
MTARHDALVPDDAQPGSRAMDVSVLTPSYEYGRFIADGIESVIQQQGLRLQHIIQDAGSGDETLEVLRSFGDRVEWASETDLGQSDGLNRALPKATGDWIAWLNADEYYLPDGLRVLVEEGERSGADVVYGDCVTVDREGRVIGLRPQHPFSRLILRLYGPFPESVSLIIRRTSLGEDPWDPSLRTVMDWDLYLGLAAEGASFHYVPYPIGAFRQHDSQASDRGGRRETRHVRERHAIPTGRWSHRAGKMLHVIRKLSAGSYRRQLRARSFKGLDLRWFKERNGIDTFRLLLDRCYRVRTDAERVRCQGAR